MRPVTRLGFIIPGEPVAQGRGRAIPTARGIRVKEPDRSRSWKAYARHVFARTPEETRRELWDVPLAVTIRAVWACPKKDARAQGAFTTWRPKAPDADNVAKAVLDAGNGILWEDDRRVVSLTVHKVQGGADALPLVEVTVEPIGGAW